MAKMRVESAADQLFFLTTKIDTVGPDGEGSGTGFFFQQHDGDIRNHFLVTNKHVVSGTDDGTLTFHQMQNELPELGKTFQVRISDWTQAWFGHPDNDVDIAIFPLGSCVDHIKTQFGIEVFFRALDPSLIPSSEQLNDLDSIEPITFVGYPNGMWDEANFLPIVRRGTTASPLSVDFGNSPRFLIDASVFGGSSGSPVLLLNQGMYSTRQGTIRSGTRFMFLGVIAEVFYRTESLNVIEMPIPVRNRSTVKQVEMIDIGVVYKARTVLETIEECKRLIPNRELTLRVTRV